MPKFNLYITCRFYHDSQIVYQVLVMYDSADNKHQQLHVAIFPY